MFVILNNFVIPSFSKFFYTGFSGECTAKGWEVVGFTCVEVEPERQHDRDTGDKGKSPELSGKAGSSRPAGLVIENGQGSLED